MQGWQSSGEKARRVDKRLIHCFFLLWKCWIGNSGAASPKACTRSTPACQGGMWWEETFSFHADPAPSTSLFATAGKKGVEILWLWYLGTEFFYKPGEKPFLLMRKPVEQLKSHRFLVFIVIFSWVSTEECSGGQSYLWGHSVAIRHFHFFQPWSFSILPYLIRLINVCL